MGTTFIENELLKRSPVGILTPMRDDDEIKSPGLEDLIAGITPTFDSWTNDPTDAGNITDDDISTFCTTGNRVIGAGYQYAYLEWDLGTFYNVLIGGVGNLTASAGSPRLWCSIWDGTNWIITPDAQNISASPRLWDNFSGRGSKVRIGVTGTAAATLTPNIREFHVWRL